MYITTYNTIKAYIFKLVYKKKENIIKKLKDNGSNNTNIYVVCKKTNKLSELTRKDFESAIEIMYNSKYISVSGQESIEGQLRECIAFVLCTSSCA